ncbi:MAG TPA: tRNA-intron lyase [Thermoplasmatales archaeon]|nr:tRNA-intron lyase [Thermoplasmatales archaeon]
MEHSMKPIIAKLVDDKIVISKPKGIGRIHSKSRIGKLVDNKLYLQPLEAVFLLEEEKIKLIDDTREITFEELFKKAADGKNNFETQYLIYRNLRNRGYQPTIIDQQTLSLNKNLVFTFAETDATTAFKLERLCEDINYKELNNWIGLVDEEGDITYYDISLKEPIGEISNRTTIEVEGVLLNNRVILFDQDKLMQLHRNEFYGKPFKKGLQLSLIEAFYLMKQKLLTIIKPSGEEVDISLFKEFLEKKHPEILFRYPIYEDLKKRALIVKTGFKFGTHFRAYTNLPNYTHAEYLIHVIEPTREIDWSEISRGIRMAHAVRKTFLFAFKNKNKIIYLKLSRIRP